MMKQNGNMALLESVLGPIPEAKVNIENPCEWLAERVTPAELDEALLLMETDPESPRFVELLRKFIQEPGL